MAAKAGQTKFVGPEIGPLQVKMKVCKRIKEPVAHDDPVDEVDGMELVLSINGTELVSLLCGKDMYQQVGFGILANLNEQGRLKS